MNKTLKKTLLYRGLSILSEALIVLAWTGRIDITGGITLTCVVVHTLIYYLVEKRY